MLYNYIFTKVADYDDIVRICIKKSSSRNLILRLQIHFIYLYINHLYLFKAFHCQHLSSPSEYL